MTMILLICTTMAYSQESTVNSTLSTVDSITTTVSDAVAAVDTSSLYKTIYNDVKVGLQGLAGALKVSAEHVYTVLVRQQIVKSVTGLLYIIICSIMLYLGIKYLVPWSVRQGENSEGFSYIPSLLYIIIVFVLLIVSCLNIDTIITGFVNPEYGAIQEIFSWISR